MNIVEVPRATVVPCVSSNVIAAALTTHREAMTVNHKQLAAIDRFIPELFEDSWQPTCPVRSMRTIAFGLALCLTAACSRQQDTVPPPPTPVTPVEVLPTQGTAGTVTTPVG